MAMRASQVAWAVLAAGVAGFGGLTAVRWVGAHGDAERAAEAAAALAAANVRSEGMPLDAGEQRAIGERARVESGVGSPLRFEWRVSEEAGVVLIAARAVTSFDLPLLVPASIETSADAFQTIEPRPPAAPPPAPMIVVVPPPPPAPAPRIVGEIDRVEKVRARVVLVLDLSGSMQMPLGGGPLAGDDSSYAALRRALDRFQPDVELGLVTYASSVGAAVPVGEASADAIRELLANNHGCPFAGPCLTATGPALKRAAELLAARPGVGNSYVILVSDGMPTLPGPGSPPAAMESARAAASRLWDQGATLFTIQLMNAPLPQVQVMSDFMLSVSGTPGSHADASYHFAVDSEEALREVLRSIATEPAYAAGPVQAPPAGMVLEVALRARDGVETAIRPRVHGNMLRLDRAQAARIEHGAVLVVRHAPRAR